MLQKAIYSPLAALVLGQQWQLWLAVQPGSAGKERKKECDTAGESAACLKNTNTTITTYSANTTKNL
jgi:hypothetical protein